MPDLLIEIGCEELPAAACREAERQLPELLTRSLAEAGLESRDPRIHVGPRRLVAIASVPPQRDAVATRAARPARRRARGGQGRVRAKARAGRGRAGSARGLRMGRQRRPGRARG